MSLVEDCALLIFKYIPFLFFLNFLYKKNILAHKASSILDYNTQICQSINAVIIKTLWIIQALTSIIPSSLLRSQNLSSLRGLVKILATWFLVLTCSNLIFSFATRSLIKWYLISICLVFECWTGFLLKLIALVLSHWIKILLLFMPKSLLPRWLPKRGVNLVFLQNLILT